jgi:hypothetical protein
MLTCYVDLVSTWIHRVRSICQIHLSSLILVSPLSHHRLRTVLLPIVHFLPCRRALLPTIPKSRVAEQLRASVYLSPQWKGVVGLTIA